VTGPERKRAFGYLYGAAHLGKSLTWYFSELLFAYFLTEFCGLRALTMGQVLAASFVFSALVDPLVGKALGRLAQSVETASRLQAFGAMVSGASLLIFSATGLMPGSIRFGYALTAICAFRLAYAFYDVPQNAILSLAIATHRVRMNLSAIRTAGSGLATLVVALTAANLIGSAPGLGASRFLGVSLVFAVLGGISAIALGALASGPGPPIPTTAMVLDDDDLASAPSRFWSFLAILGATAAVAGAFSIFTRLEPYFTSAVLADRSTRMAVLALMALGGASSQPLWTGLSRRHSVGAAFTASAVTAVIGAVAFIVGVGRNTGIIAFGGFLFSAGHSGLGMLLWSLFADVVAKGRQSRHIPNAGFAFSILTSTIKLASAASILVVSWILTGIDYHSVKVAASWSLLTPMAAGPLIGAAVCLLIAERLFAKDGRHQPSDASNRPWARHI